MVRRRIPARLARRLAGALLAAAVVLQAGAPVPLAGARGGSCCCHHEDDAAPCHCPSCVHGRELAAGQPVLRSCAGDSGQRALVFGPAPMVIPAGLVLPAPRHEGAPPRAPAPVHVAPDPELETPPPLA